MRLVAAQPGLAYWSLTVYSIVARLKEVEVGVKCVSKLISMLLYAGDAVIFPEDEK